MGLKWVKAIPTTVVLENMVPTHDDPGLESQETSMPVESG